MKVDSKEKWDCHQALFVIVEDHNEHHYHGINSQLMVIRDEHHDQAMSTRMDSYLMHEWMTFESIALIINPLLLPCLKLLKVHLRGWIQERIRILF